MIQNSITLPLCDLLRKSERVTIGRVFFTTTTKSKENSTFKWQYFLKVSLSSQLEDAPNATPIESVTNDSRYGRDVI